MDNLSKCELIKLYRTIGAEYWNIADVFEEDIEEISKHIQNSCDCDSELSISNGKPWTEYETMRRLFEQKTLYFTQIADILDCHPETSREWVINKHDIGFGQNTSSKKVREVKNLGLKIDDGDDPPGKAIEDFLDDD
jgi:hypothetical protein